VYSRSGQSVVTHSRKFGLRRSGREAGDPSPSCRGNLHVFSPARHAAAARFHSRGSAAHMHTAHMRKNMRGTNCAGPYEHVLGRERSRPRVRCDSPGPVSSSAACQKQHGGAGELERKRAEKMWRDGDEGARQAWQWTCIHARGRAGLVPGAEHVFCLLDFPPQVPSYINYPKPSLDGRRRAKEAKPSPQKPKTSKLPTKSLLLDRSSRAEEVA